jgi:hypothetical protein
MDLRQIPLRYGLKFHISLPEWDREHYKSGCDIVADILMENGISFKYIKDRYKMSADGEQAGKDITVAAAYNPEKDVLFWSRLLTQITRKLVNSDINPGYRVLGSADKPERPIRGSNYVTYRYENELLQGLDWPPDDPASHIEVNVQKQKEPRVFQESQDHHSSSVGIGKLN